MSGIDAFRKNRCGLVSSLTGEEAHVKSGNLKVTVLLLPRRGGIHAEGKLSRSRYRCEYAPPC